MVVGTLTCNSTFCLLQGFRGPGFQCRPPASIDHLHPRSHTGDKDPQMLASLNIFNQLKGVTIEDDPKTGYLSVILYGL